MNKTLKLGRMGPPVGVGQSAADKARLEFELKCRRVQELEEHLKRQRGLEISLSSKLGDGGSKVMRWRSKLCKEK